MRSKRCFLFFLNYSISTSEVALLIRTLTKKVLWCTKIDEFIRTVKSSFGNDVVLLLLYYTFVHRRRQCAEDFINEMENRIRKELQTNIHKFMFAKERFSMFELFPTVFNNRLLTVELMV